MTTPHTDSRTGQTPTHDLRAERHQALKILRILSGVFGFAAAAMVAAGAMLLSSPIEPATRFGLTIAGAGFGMGLACLAVAVTGIVYGHGGR
jgi:uncharacterized membrane protein